MQSAADHGVRERRYPSRRILLVDLPLPSPKPDGREWIEAYQQWRALVNDDYTTRTMPFMSLDPAGGQWIRATAPVSLRSALPSKSAR